ncbi:MAG: MATE family efflux transporter, partial [Phycicoccus sp.]
SHAASIQISEASGVGDYVTARRTGLLGVGWGVLAMVLVAVVYLTLPEQVVSLFVPDQYADDGSVAALIVVGLLIAAVMQIFDAGQSIGGGILRGLGDTAGPFRISLFGYWLIGLPAAYLLGVTAGWGVEGVWTGQSIGLAVTAVLLLVAFLRRVERLRRQRTGATVGESRPS